MSHVRDVSSVVQAGSYMPKMPWLLKPIGLYMPKSDSSDTEQGDIEQIGLTGVDDAILFQCDARWDQHLFDGICMNSVIDLVQGTLKTPLQGGSAGFFILEPLEFLDEVKLELRTEP